MTALHTLITSDTSIAEHKGGMRTRWATKDLQHFVCTKTHYEIARYPFIYMYAVYNICPR